jgi:hypothetical protein
VAFGGDAFRGGGFECVDVEARDVLLNDVLRDDGGRGNAPGSTFNDGDDWCGIAHVVFVGRDGNVFALLWPCGTTTVLVIRKEVYVCGIGFFGTGRFSSLVSRTGG